MKPSFTTRQAPRAAGPTVLHDGSRVSKKLGRKAVDWEKRLSPLVEFPRIDVVVRSRTTWIL
jgi:hypothetical protein